MRLTVCSDLHNGPAGHPATDATPGWRAAWAKVPEPKLRLGDMDELLQFTAEEIGELAGTEILGNHDQNSPSTMGESTGWWTPGKGWTVFLHGHQFDPWAVRLASRPVAWSIGLLERRWPNIDEVWGGWFRQHCMGGRRGEWDSYKAKAARYAAERGAWQIVFGHLHELRDEWVVVDHNGRLVSVHVVCTGCCVGGRMDFVEVEV